MGRVDVMSTYELHEFACDRLHFVLLSGQDVSSVLFVEVKGRLSEIVRVSIVDGLPDLLYDGINLRWRCGKRLSNTTVR